MSIRFIAQPDLRTASDLVLTADLAFAYGLIGCDLRNPRTALAESVEVQTRKIMSNLDDLLAEQGLSRRNVLVVTVFLRDFHRFHARFEKVWIECFDASCRPTRQLVGATDLFRSALVSMDFVVSRTI